VARLLILGGVVLIVLGLSWPLIARLGLGRLPGDIVVRGEHGGFYFPVMTCILVSVVLSLLFWLAGRF
jgi:hypothetical protein